MLNVILDPLPEEWNGYPINADFRTGILISMCMADESLSDVEKFFTATELLFPADRPDNEETAAAINWFMTGYNHDNHSKDCKSEDIIMDFDVDQWRISAAFLSQYQIDLSTVQMHWFFFMGLLTNLNECAFTNVMNIRQKKLTSRMSAEEKKAIGEAKKIFSIRPPKKRILSAQEQKDLNDFMQYADLNKGK